MRSTRARIARNLAVYVIASLVGLLGITVAKAHASIPPCQYDCHASHAKRVHDKHRFHKRYRHHKLGHAKGAAGYLNRYRYHHFIWEQVKLELKYYMLLFAPDKADAAPLHTARNSRAAPQTYGPWKHTPGWYAHQWLKSSCVGNPFATPFAQGWCAFHHWTEVGERKLSQAFASKPGKAGITPAICGGGAVVSIGDAGLTAPIFMGLAGCGWGLYLGLH